VDKEKLIKCLKLTASANDHEALAAIRAANAIRTEAGQSWEELLNPPVEVTGANLRFYKDGVDIDLSDLVSGVGIRRKS
jgi:hypothetical protein